MSRYRKIEVRIWSDEKFRGLSAMPPSGQGLWFFLLTGPHTTAIPGLFRAGRAAMAEELNWDMKAFDEAFREVFAQGMVKADFKAKLVWLPKALQHNKPESPNVVRGWRVELDLLPECALKAEALAAIGVALKALGPSYAEAFHEASDGGRKPCAKPSRKPCRKPSEKTMANQEQEQEQEQDREDSAEPPRDSPPAICIPLVGGKEHPVAQTAVDEWTAAYPAVDVLQQLREMRQWSLANSANRKTPRGIDAFINRWLSREQDKGPTRPLHKPAPEFV